MGSQEHGLLIRVQEEASLAAAAELKLRLLEGVAAGDLDLDLESLADVDVALLQLLVAAGREAERSGGRIVARWSPAARAAARDAGFESFPGFALPEETWPK